ncbi:unnamed protein product [Rotaria sp. Silwood1]|nr:unnamed protein product [Rotaria sp. Silwood1]
MHLTLSTHLLTLDKRYELVRWPQRVIGLIYYKGCDYVRAPEQWTRIMDDNDKNDSFHKAICCFYLDLTYSKLKHYKQAIEVFERALVHTCNMPAIFEAQCQMQIGHSIELQGIDFPRCFQTARVHYEKALDLYENHIEPPDEVALALCYAVIRNCHFFENAFSEDANRYYLKAIHVYDAIFLLQAPPPVLTQARLIIVGVLFHIALTYYQEFSMI